MKLQVTSNKCIASSNKCIASSNKCLTTSNKKLLETSALLVVTISYKYLDSRISLGDSSGLLGQTKRMPASWRSLANRQVLTRPVVPQPVAAPRVGSRTASKLNVTWTAPENGGWR